MMRPEKSAFRFWDESVTMAVFLIVVISKGCWRREMFRLEIAKKIAQKVQTVAHGDIIS